MTPPIPAAAMARARSAKRPRRLAVRGGGGMEAARYCSGDWKRQRGGFGSIAGIEVAAAEQGNAEDLEIAGSNNVQFSDGLVRGVALLAFDEELVVKSRRFVEREDARSRGGSDTGKGLDFLEERIEEAEGFLVAGVAREIGADWVGENVFGAEAGVDALEIDQAADGEPGAAEE